MLQETYVARLPVRRISFATAKLEREQLVMEGKRFYQDCVKSNDWGKMLSFVGQLLPQKREGTPDTEHERSDVVHDLLAFLAEERTRLNKQKQAEIKGFLAWLEDYLGISLENLRNKTKVKDDWKADFESLFSALE